MLTAEKRTDILEKIAVLEKEHDAAEDFGERVDIKGRIHNLKMILEGVKPESSEEIDCVGCH